MGKHSQKFNSLIFMVFNWNSVVIWPWLWCMVWKIPLVNLGELASQGPTLSPFMIWGNVERQSWCSVPTLLSSHQTLVCYQHLSRYQCTAQTCEGCCRKINPIQTAKPQTQVLFCLNVSPFICHELLKLSYWNCSDLYSINFIEYWICII